LRAQKTGPFAGFVFVFVLRHMEKSTKKITVEDIKALATLANIPVPESHLESLASSVESIIRHMEKIMALDLGAVPETARVTEEVNVWREDTVEPSLSQNVALRNGVSHEGYFDTPAIFET